MLSKPGKAADWKCANMKEMFVGKYYSGRINRGQNKLTFKITDCYINDDSGSRNFNSYRKF